MLHCGDSLITLAQRSPQLAFSNPVCRREAHITVRTQPEMILVTESEIGQGTTNLQDGCPCLRLNHPYLVLNHEKEKGKGKGDAANSVRHETCITPLPDPMQKN